MAPEPINWAQVDVALNAAESGKNHYRHFQQLETLILVVKQAKTMLDSAELDRADAVAQTRKQLDELKAVEARIGEARKAADAERERLAAASARAKEELSALHQDWRQKIAQAGDEHKAVLAQTAAARETMDRAAQTRQAELDQDHARRVAALREEISTLTAQRDRLNTEYAALKSRLLTLAG